MTTAIFEADGAEYAPTELARGPWDPASLHGGAPAALMVSAIEALESERELDIRRVTVEFLRPVPMDRLALALQVLRPGRRAQLVQASLSARGAEVCRATALRTAKAPASLALAGQDEREERPLSGPEQGRAISFSLDGQGAVGFAGAMEMRFVTGDSTPGPATVWMRLRHPLVHERPTSSTAAAVAVADFANGVSAALDFGRFIFINTDLTVYLHRPPGGEWICLQAHTDITPGAGAMTDSALADERGPIGRACQALVVEARG